MKQLPTKRQMGWIFAVAGAMTLLGASGSIALAAGYFVGQVVMLTILVIVAKVLRSGAARVLGRNQPES